MNNNSENNIINWFENGLTKSKIYIILGGRGSGKTCLGYYLLREHQLTKRKAYTYNFPKPKLLPKWVTNINEITKAQKGSCLLIDEGGIEFNQYSFNSKKSIELSNMLKVARHRDMSIILISQNGGTLTRDIRRLVDCYLLRKPSFTQLYDEISIIKRMYQNSRVLFSPEEAQTKGFFITEIGELAYFDKPKWFTNEISKAYDGEGEIINLSRRNRKT